MDAAGLLLRPAAAAARLDRASIVGPGPARAVLTLVLLLALLVAAAYAGPSAHAALGDPALMRLLRAMAVIKAGMAAAVIAAVFWRLGVAATPLALAGYAAVCAAMASGPLLIWGMAHVVLGALVLHAGLLAGALLLWRDPATTARLKALIAARRLARE
jgi:hypothetical protein